MWELFVNQTPLDKHKDVSYVTTLGALSKEIVVEKKKIKNFDVVFFKRRKNMNYKM